LFCPIKGENSPEKTTELEWQEEKAQMHLQNS
jgi:hypothetical protein